VQIAVLAECYKQGELAESKPADQMRQRPLPDAPISRPPRQSIPIHRPAPRVSGPTL
jgi:hypothetical protein